VSPEQLLAAIVKRGVVSTSLRDAAHEACHALQWGVKRKWTRDNIHAKKPKRHRLFGDIGVRDEIVARAVEQIVCHQLGVDCGSVEHWAQVCWMETMKNERISLPSPMWLADQIRKQLDSATACRLADEVIGLGDDT
jgi:hypothetical protein